LSALKSPNLRTIAEAHFSTMSKIEKNIRFATEFLPKCGSMFSDVAIQDAQFEPLRQFGK
jgi:hypothetical protein